jgi:hypothetical protein
MTMRIIIIALALFVVGCFLLVIFLIRLIKRLYFKPKEGKSSQPPATVSFLAIIAAVVILILSWVMFWSACQLQHFKPYTPSSNICMIEIRQTDDPVKAISFLVYPLNNNSHDTPTEFYLSGDTWYLKGQYIKSSGFIRRLIGWPYIYKMTDFYGDYTGLKPPGINVPILNHQVIEGGAVDIGEYVSAISFLKNAIEVGEFQSQALTAKEHISYWLALSDSNTVKLEKANIRIE